jgi:hypothetical protein
MLGLTDLMPDCWFEVSLHPEGPATGQLDQGFLWFSLVPEQMLSWYPNSSLHCTLPMQPSQWQIKKCCPTLTFDFGLDHPVHGGYG